MWRKPEEAKPSPKASEPPVPALVRPQTAPPAASPTPVFSAPVSAPVHSSASTIGAGLKIRGDIYGNSDLLVDGELQGKIRLTKAKVTVGSNGRVQADIEAREIVIDGTVQGNLKASDRVSLGSKSRVQGSMLTPRIAIEDGARLRGKVEMTRADEAGASTVAEPAADSDTLRPVSARAEGE